jgi:hypothetical protein
MKTLVGKFSFVVPGTPGEPGVHADAGKKMEKAFEYEQVESLDEANKVLADKKWDIVGMVNDVLKANARSNAYQAATLPYRPSTVEPEDIKERMVRDYIRLGIPEEIARAQVESLLANAASAKA